MTAAAVRSPINLASAIDIGACVAMKMPNQLAPASAKKNVSRSQPNTMRLIRRRTRHDLFAASTLTMKSSEKNASRWIGKWCSNPLGFGRYSTNITAGGQGRSVPEASGSRRGAERQFRLLHGDAAGHPLPFAPSPPRSLTMLPCLWDQTLSWLAGGNTPPARGTGLDRCRSSWVSPCLRAISYKVDIWFQGKASIVNKLSASLLGLQPAFTPPSS